MPSRPKRICSHPGCTELTDTGRCDKHRKQVDRQRGTATERGYDSRWQKARLTWLRSHPLCAECERQGKVTAATIVDHVRPHKGDQRLFWDAANNWQSLCKRHHDIKTAKEDGGFGR